MPSSDIRLKKVLVRAVYGIIYSTFVYLSGCSNEQQKQEELVAKRYCGSCHAFPAASLLDKTTWANSVLPSMGKMMGVKGISNNPFEEVDELYNPPQPSMATPEEWKKIVSYYISNAPEVAPPQSRNGIKDYTTQFLVVAAPSNASPPANTFVKIDQQNRLIYAANRFDSAVYVYNSNVNLLSKQNVHGVLIDMDFNPSLQQAGERKGVLTKIGIMDPNDFKTGSAETFEMDGTGKIHSQLQLFDTLQRPVQVVATDLDRNGATDYVVCAFGNKMGSFYWMRNLGNNRFESKPLKDLPGAIKCYVDDYNSDGWADIMVLFGQAEEGIYLFLNKGDGQFEEKQILRFPPVYGSSYFELQDMNGDGKKDIIYTCGDNADYSSKVLKNYHGVYVFLNEGNFAYREMYFFPLNGAYKAIARDYDRDGDMDIAAISFFPDKMHQPQEAFVYLENTGQWNFKPATISGYNQGNWITMDAGDVDQDGDEDIVIGSLFLPYQTSGKEQQFADKPLFLLLRNNAVR